MAQASIPKATTGREAKIEKARRLAPTVEHKHGPFFRVGGHELMVAATDTHCSCQAAYFGHTCSHKIAVELALQAERRAA